VAAGDQKGRTGGLRPAGYRQWLHQSLAPSTPGTLTAEVPAVAADGAVPDDAMWDVLATLPPRQRAVLVLRFYEDLSEREIATALSVAPGTVKSQASKGLAALRVALARQEKSWTR